MASISPTHVCPACLQNFDDARVLSCLHSVCKACIDQMAVTATDGVVTCPICRAKERLSPNGAAALPKDVTVSPSSSCGSGLDHDVCGLCQDDTKKPVSWCKVCRLALCESHTVPHMMSAASGGGDHMIVPISKASQENASGDKDVDAAPSTTTRVCSFHGEPLKYHCGTCDVAICGGCGLIGDHKKHDNVRLIKDILNDRKTEVNAKADTLENDVVPKLEHSIQAVDSMSTELARRADEVRTDIRKAGKQVVEMVEAHVEQMVQEVDYLELSRCKILDRQREELKSHLDAAKNAVDFHDRVMVVTNSEESQLSLLHALKTRMTALITSNIKDKPQHHANLQFQPASHKNLASKAKEAIGRVIPCQGSAKFSEIKGGNAQRTTKATPVSITVYAKDFNGEKLTTGGDVISTRWAGMLSAENTPSTTITDNANGSYTIVCVCPTAGTFQLEAYVNGEKMATNVAITCVALRSTFDPNECHPSITISTDRRKASTNRSGLRHVSVLGSFPMQHGQYTWKIRIGEVSDFHMLGISSKDKPTTHKDDYSSAYCWYSKASHPTGQFFRDGVQAVGKVSDWRGSDTFQLDLDCDRHTLRITNLRSGEHSTFSNLPDKEYFQYANLHQKENSVEFVE